MATAQLKKKVIAAMDDMPEEKVLEVLDFVSYLKLREDAWFIDFVNKRGPAWKDMRYIGGGFLKIMNPEATKIFTHDVKTEMKEAGKCFVYNNLGK